MKCRVGMTANLAERKRYWMKRCPGLSGWMKYGPIPTREEAQRAETLLASQNGCKAEAGGRPPENEKGPWYLYKFYYTIDLG